MSVLAQDKPTRGALRRKQFRADIPFTKTAVTKSGDLELTGYANTWAQDRDGDIVDPKAFDDTLGPYLQKNPIVLLFHDMDIPIGTVTNAYTDETGLYVKALVPKPADGEMPEIVTAYNKIAAGILRTLSVGGFMSYDIEGQQLIIRKIELYEISVVSVPANADSIFEATIKAARGESEKPVRQLSERAVSQMKQLLGVEKMTDPDLSSMDEDARSARHAELCALYEAADCDPPEYDSWSSLESKVALVKDEPLEMAALVPEIVLLTKRASGAVPLAKKGRMISAANEEKLRGAVQMHKDAMDMQKKAVDQVTDVLDLLANDEGSTDNIGEDDGPAGNMGVGEMSTKGALSAPSAPFADRGHAWDASAAQMRLRTWAGVTDSPNAKLKQAYLFQEGDGSKFGDLKYPVCDVVGGELKVIFRAVSSAAGRASQQGLDALKPALETLYNRAAKQFDDDSIKPPWKD